MPVIEQQQQNAMRSRIKQRFQTLPEDQAECVVGLVNDLILAPDDEAKTEIATALVEILLPELMDWQGDDVGEDRTSEARRKLEAHRAYVGQQIKKHREELEMTQEELAEKAGIPQSHVCRLERGKHTATYLTIRKVAKALKTTPEKLDPMAP